MKRSDTNRISTVKALPADEDIWRPHVTVATVVPRDGRFLLVEEDVRGRIVLNQPAGHLDPDEAIQHAAVRETLEETGWDIELDCLLCVQQWRNAESGRQFVRFTFGEGGRSDVPFAGYLRVTQGGRNRKKRVDLGTMLPDEPVHRACGSTGPAQRFHSVRLLRLPAPDGRRGIRTRPNIHVRETYGIERRLTSAG